MGSATCNFLYLPKDCESLASKMLGESNQRARLNKIVIISPKHREEAYDLEVSVTYISYCLFFVHVPLLLWLRHRHLSRDQ